MILDTNWILQEPIDLEHKQYVLLDYIDKVNKDFNDFKLYPSFQELAIHLANISMIKDKSQYLTLKLVPKDIDDEILIDDLLYKNLNYTEDDLLVIKKVSKYAQDKLTDLFLIGKAIWTILYDSVTIRNMYSDSKDNVLTYGIGFFYIVYDDLLHIYDYKIKKIKETTYENKCEVTLIYKDKVIDNTDKNIVLSIIKKYHQLDDFEGKSHTIIQDIESRYPIFRIKYEQKFPLEGGILSIAKRKIMNYIFQTIKIQELKS
tara:strand:- start:894 stop:1673 length:780 start_codon:yes stop_codon:yes gene_type:complete